MIALKQVPIEKSSQVSAYGHEPAQQVLRVVYRSGKAYDYKPFGADDLAKLEAAPSLGKHINTHVKGVCECVPAADEAESEDAPITTTSGATVDLRAAWMTKFQAEAQS